MFEEECTINSSGLFFNGLDANMVWQDTYTVMPKELQKLITKTGYIFNEIKKLSPYIQEVQFVGSKTHGTQFKPGYPSTKGGENLWCRVKIHNWGPWIFIEAPKNVGFVTCMKYIMYSPQLRVALLQGYLSLPQHCTPAKSEPQTQKHSVEENLERIANSLEKIEKILRQYIDLQR